MVQKPEFHELLEAYFKREEFGMDPPCPPALPPLGSDIAAGGLVGGEKQRVTKMEWVTPASSSDPTAGSIPIQVANEDGGGNMVHGPPNIDEFNAMRGVLALPPPPCPTTSSSLVTSMSDPAISSGTFGNRSFTGAPHLAIIGDNLDENSHHYVGLVNQAMTCYLNSLIQTLYMTPEFRNAIYNWRFSGTPREETRSIPFQLQKLFLLLQTSDKHSLETKDLTASFGWESNDAYDQHDVQELCRLMFDALEHRWRKTENRSLIQDLYKGNVEDFVKCLKCGTTRAKPDVFLDLPLAVKEFGAKESYKSIEEALSAFIKPELLDGNNQYSCEKCKSKQNAEKGLRITQFPYLLTIQLKRFDFDYQTLHRIKLNDRMTFPDILDLNEFLHSEKHSAKTVPERPTPPRSYANVASTSGSNLSKETIEEEDCEESRTEKAADSRKDELAAEEKECWTHWKRDSPEVAEIVKKKGKYLYELFSIMVHQGSASGGHYYAYIKNLGQNRWFCFNDSSVQPASMFDIYKTFGGGTGGWSVSNTNAYMLMYRRIDFSANKDFVRTTDLPPHLMDLREKMANEEVERLRLQKEQEEMIKVNYFVNDNRSFYAGCIDGLEKVIDGESVVMNRRWPIGYVLEQLVDAISSELISAEASRLIVCDRYWNMLEVAEDKEAPLSSVVKDDSYFLLRDEVYLVLDTKMKNEFYPFPDRALTTNKINLCTVDVIHISLRDEQKMQLERRICFDNHSTVADLRPLLFFIIPDYHCPDMKSMEKTRIVVDHPADEMVQLTLLTDDQCLSNIPEIRQWSTTKAQLLIDGEPPQFANLLEDDRKREFRDSLFFKLIDARKFRTRLKIVLPNKTDYQQAGMMWRMPDLRRLPRAPIQLDPLVSCALPTLQKEQPHPPGSPSRALPMEEGPAPELSASFSVGDVAPSLSSLDDLTTSVTVPLAYPCQDSPASSNSASNLDAMGGEGGEGEDEQMDVSCMSTPKRSPVVSEGSCEEGEGAPFSKQAKSGGELGWKQAEINSKLNRLIEESSVSLALRQEMAVEDESLSMHNSNTVTVTTSHYNLKLDQYQRKVQRQQADDGQSMDEETVYGGESTTTDSTPSTSTTTATAIPTFAFPVAVVNMSGEVKDERSDRQWIKVEVDKRQLCSDLKRWLGHYLQLDTGCFNIFKHYGISTSEGAVFPSEDGYGCFAVSADTIRDSLCGANHLSVRLEVPRKENEIALAIWKFERDQPDLQQWPVLFQIPAGRETTAGEVITKCYELLHKTYDLEYRIEQLRLRDLTENGAIALRKSEKLEMRGPRLWDKPLYLQISEDDEVFSGADEERTVPVMVQQWCPSSLDVKPLRELHLRTEVQGEAKALRKLIAQHTLLPVERIQLSEPNPNGLNTKWPFTKGVLELVDGGVKFSADQPSPPLDGSYGGKLVYFKDSNEFPKNISDEERKSIRIRENAQSSSSLQSSNSFIRRRERPLRIQMNSVSENDP